MLAGAGECYQTHCPIRHQLSTPLCDCNDCNDQQLLRLRCDDDPPGRVFLYQHTLLRWSRSPAAEV
jgi:hypothetical protein